MAESDNLPFREGSADATRALGQKAWNPAYRHADVVLDADAFAALRFRNGLAQSPEFIDLRFALRDYRILATEINQGLNELISQ